MRSDTSSDIAFAFVTMKAPASAMNMENDIFSRSRDLSLIHISEPTRPY